MEDIQLWSVGNSSQVVPLKPTGRVENEWEFENILVANPGMLMEKLKLVGRQTPTEGGPLDLLGVDEDGKLVVFELKRGRLSRDAVAQVIDYASDLDGMELDDLANHISERSGEHGIESIESFEEWYNHEFGELELLKPLRMFLVGLSVDDRTERMVKFLADGNIDISLLTFHGFKYDNRIILAKQVEVERPSIEDPDSTLRTRRRRPNRRERWELLNRHIDNSGVRELFDAVRTLFEKNWPHQVEYYARTTRLSIRLPEYGGPASSRRAYARIDPENGKVRVIFYPRAVELCKDKFEQQTMRIQYETWPRNVDPFGGSDTPEIQFLLTADGWNTHKDMLTSLTQAVYEAWENNGSNDDESNSE